MLQKKKTKTKTNKQIKEKKVLVTISIKKKKTPDKKLVWLDSFTTCLLLIKITHLYQSHQSYYKPNHTKNSQWYEKNAQKYCTTHQKESYIGTRERERERERDKTQEG